MTVTYVLKVLRIMLIKNRLWVCEIIDKVLKRNRLSCSRTQTFPLSYNQSGQHMLEILATSLEFPEYASVILDRKWNTVSQERESL